MKIMPSGYNEETCSEPENPVQNISCFGVLSSASTSEVTKGIVLKEEGHKDYFWVDKQSFREAN